MWLPMLAAAVFEGQKKPKVLVEKLVTLSRNCFRDPKENNMVKLQINKY